MKASLGYRSILLGLFVNVLLDHVKSVEYQTMHVCHGEIKRLKCESGEVLTVFDVIYQSISKNSTLCLGSEQSSVQCPIMRLIPEVRENCNKKEKCFVNYQADPNDKGMTSCQRAIVLKVTYSCEKKGDSNGPPPRLFNNVNFQNDNDVSINSTVVSNRTNPAISRQKLGPSPLALQLLYYFLDTRIIIKRIKVKPKGFLLAVTLSMAGGMFILVIFCACVALYSRCKKKKDKVDMEDGQQPTVEVSSPVVQTSVPVAYDTVVVTTSNGSTSTYTTLNRDGTLGRSSKPFQNHQLISSIRRSHSIDEGTQTDNESEFHEQSVSKHSGSISHEEAQELGYLVDVMKYYNSRLDDEFFSEPISSKNKDNDTNFFFTTEVKNPTLKSSPLNKQISLNSTSTNRYMGDAELSSSDEKFKTLPTRNTPGKFPIETRKDDDDIDFYSPESIFNGDTLKFTTIPRTPKLGIRGDGYDAIISSDVQSSSNK